MKKIILSCVAMMAAFFCVSNVSAQGVKIHKAGGEVIDIPAAELDFIEAYDATEASNSFEGTWKMKKLITDQVSMSDAWGGMVTFGDAFPTFEAEDELTFKDGKIIPNLKSNLKNFFIGEATYEVVDEAYVIHPTAVTGAAVTVTELKVKGVNRNFDANSKSEDDEAYIGVRLVEDEDADEAGIYYLEVYLFDYKATSFAPEWSEFGMYSDEKPQAAYSDMPIYFSMTKNDAATAKRRASPISVSGWETLNGVIQSNVYSVVFIGASWSGPSNIAKATLDSYMEGLNNIGYAIVSLTGSDFSNDVANHYTIRDVPTTLIVDNSGSVKERTVGIPTSAFLNVISAYAWSASTGGVTPESE